MTSVSVSARASAERGPSSNRPSSPNRPPLSRTATIDSRPSVDRVEIAIRPVLHDEELGGLVALAEQQVALGEVADAGLAAELVDHPSGRDANSSVESSTRRSGTRPHTTQGSGRSAARSPVPWSGFSFPVSRSAPCRSTSVTRSSIPHHGAATIEKREKKEAFGKKQDYLVLRLAYGDLTLMVPADNAEEIGLRDVINDEEVEEVFAVLRKKEARMPTNWSRRFKNHVEKLKSGDIYQVAEVVRNLTIREKDKGLSAGEKRMLGKARQILVSELTFALNVDEETAEDKLDEVLGKPRSTRTPQLDRPRRRRRAHQGAAADHAAEAAKAPPSRRPRPPRRPRRKEAAAKARRRPRPRPKKAPAKAAKAK